MRAFRRARSRCTEGAARRGESIDLAAPPIDPRANRSAPGSTRLCTSHDRQRRPIYLEVVALSSYQGRARSLVRVDEVRAMITPFIMQFTWHTSITSSPRGLQARHAHTDARNLSTMSSPTSRARARARPCISSLASYRMQRRGIEIHVLPEEARSACPASARQDFSDIVDVPRPPSL